MKRFNDKKHGIIAKISLGGFAITTIYYLIRMVLQVIAAMKPTELLPMAVKHSTIMLLMTLIYGLICGVWGGIIKRTTKHLEVSFPKYILYGGIILATISFLLLIMGV